MAINLLKGDSPMAFDSGHICYLYTVELQRGSNGFLVSKYQRTGPFLLSIGGEILVTENIVSTCCQHADGPHINLWIRPLINRNSTILGKWFRVL